MIEHRAVDFGIDVNSSVISNAKFDISVNKKKLNHTKTDCEKPD